MATSQNGKRSQSTASRAERFNNDKFVNYELTVDEKARCKAWLPTLEEFDDALLKIEESGYRVATKYDNWGNCYGAFITAVEATNSNSGLILTGRGSTPCKAIKQAMFKHFVVFDMEWGGWAERSADLDFDD